MATLLGKIVADFTSQLATKMEVGTTTATLQAPSGTLVDDDGVALPAGRYFFTIDGDNSRKEHISCDLSNTALTNIKSVSRQGVETTGVAREHRIGATVTITDFAHIKYINDLIGGTTNLNASEPLEYDGTATINSNNQLATKAYVDGVAISGAPDASTSTKGIVKMSTAPASASNPVAVGDNDTRVPTQSENDALAGTSGTPSSTNKFVTADDVSSVGASNKVVRAAGTALPALDGSNLTLGLHSYTAGDDILQNDSVYMTAADTVNKMVPSTIGTPVVTTTAPTNSGSQKRSLKMPTNGVYMHFNGGYSATAAVLSAQKRTLNTAETDFSNESAFNLYATGNGTRHYDVCSLGSDKFLAIFQCDTAGAAAGIRAVVATSSGTVGSAVVLESTGVLGEQVACAQVDTDKAALFYRKDSDGDLYVQIVTVSGTTITTNTPVLIKAFSNSNLLVTADQLATNEVILVYQDGSSSTVAMFGRTISVSGTTPTVNPENTVEASGSSSGVKVGIKALSSTKALMMYSDGAGSVNDNARHLNISGTTITASSTLTLGAARSTDYYGITGVSTTRALVTVVTGSQIITYYLNTSATAPTQIASVTITTGSPVVSASVVKVAPYTYAISAGQVTLPYIAKLTPQTARIGIAQNNIASAASGVVMQRFIRQTLAGGSLTAASIYYIDDTGQPTTDSSLTAPQLGISTSTTKILLT